MFRDCDIFMNWLMAVKAPLDLAPMAATLGV